MLYMCCEVLCCYIENLKRLLKHQDLFDFGFEQACSLLMVQIRVSCCMIS